MKRVVVLGASGMLGSMLVRQLAPTMQVRATVRDIQFIKVIPNVDWWGLNAAASDVRQQLWKAVADCDVAINAIGIIPQRFGPALSWKVNVDFPRQLRDVSHLCPVIQIATDCVYDGVRGHYTESDIPGGSAEWYGSDKWRGEFRSPWVKYLRCSIIGPEYHGKSLLGWLLGQAKGATVPGWTNHHWNGVTTLAFAKICRGVIAEDLRLPWMRHHLVPMDQVTKYELLCYLAKAFRPDVTIVPTDADGFAVDRTLATIDYSMNRELWRVGGYERVPTIRELVQELAESEVLCQV